MIEDVLSGTATHHVACERAESFIDTLPDGRVSLITIDPPYFRVKNEEAWDNAWPTPEAFIAWMGEVLAKCRRVLAPNGSIYVFAKPQSVDGGPTMATHVEIEVARNFFVLNRIAWDKTLVHTPAHYKMSKAALRSYFPNSDQIIFAGSRRSIAAAATELRVRAGLTTDDVERALGYLDNAGRGSRLCYRWECGDSVPTAAQWSDFLAAVGASGPQYEDVCRPFVVSADVPYTDVWHYDPVKTYDGKHPCEKPPLMAEHMVRASSRPGDIVADFFCGSGAFLAAAVAEGRRAIGCDMDPHWAEQASRRCDAVKASGRIPRTAPKPKNDRQIDLFGKGAA